MPALNLVDLVEKFYAAVETSGLTRSRVHFDAQNIPETAADNTFCIFLQSANSNKLRGNDVIRIVHQITVSMLFRVLPDQARTVTNHLDGEQKVMRALLNTDNIPEAYTKYMRTSRSVIMAKEKMLINLIFDVDADWESF